jgi:uncharacterized protein YhdP
LPLRVDIFPAGDRDRISVSIGRTVTAEFLRVRQGNEMQTQRTGVSLTPTPGEAVRVPERPGILVYGSLPVLDLDQWVPLFIGDGGGGAAAGSASFANLDLKLGTLDVQGKRLTEVSLRAGIDSSGGWSASLKASELAGELSYRPAGSGQLVARLSHLRIPDDAPGTAGKSEPTKDLPAIDLVAETFTYKDKRIGRVELVAQHDGPNWRIERFLMLNPDVSLSGNGQWRAGNTSVMALNLKLESSDIGKFLERVGYPDRIHGGSATVEGTITWDGTPFTLDYPTLSGDLKLVAERGEFPRLNSGIGRILSLLALSFSDAAAKGFPFDQISSSFQLQKGVMSTRDLKIRASAAEIDMRGDINLQKETQNLHVRVVPSMRRGVTALVGVVNPLFGVGAAVAQSLLKDPVGQILSYEYSVSGPWADPKIEQLNAQPRAPSGAP